MLENSNVSTRIPVQYLERARVFYKDKLDLIPCEERHGGLRHYSGNGFSSLFQSAGKASGDHTQMAWEVDDIISTVKFLRSRGVKFEEYDVPRLRTVNGIAEISGNYPSSRALGEKGACLVP